MIFYNLDGTVKLRRSEEVFGWWFQDFIIDENIEKHEHINSDRKKCFAKESLHQNSQDYLEILVEIQEPDIKLAPITSVENTVIANNFKTLQTESFLDCGDLLNEIIVLGRSKDNGPRDNRENVETRRNSINPDIPLNELHKCANGKCNNLLGNKWRNFYNKTFEMQSDIHTIRKYFEQEEVKVNNLVAESIKLREDIEECNFFDEVLLLLMGKVEVKSTKLFNDSENLII